MKDPDAPFAAAIVRKVTVEPYDRDLHQMLPVIQAEDSSHNGKELKSHDDMTMGHYQRVLENPECWSTLGWALDRTAFIGQLDELRQVRNDVLHFNPDGVPDGAVENLRRMLGLIPRVRVIGGLVRAIQAS